MKMTRILGLGLALALTGCGSDDASDANSTDTTGGDTSGTGGGTTGGETGGGEVSFTVGNYVVESQRAYATEACEGDAEPSETEGSMIFSFQGGDVFSANVQACVVGENLSDAQTQEDCEAEDGFWYTDSVGGTWSIEGSTIEIVVEQEDEEGNTETENLTCSVQSADAILCYGIETEETVDLDGNVLERVERCLELSLNLVAE